ncbi:hypothetical protein MNV49_005496 [Pseudohyphozyma bogoriensis]|nr:hypothetical protein MNV49_005496 [Pseudohyphozyma bogoriensis]
MHQTIWNPEDLTVSGYWGTAASSIDWCEPNYTWSFYVAEMVNTVSSFVLVVLAVYGAYYARQQQLPARLVLVHAGSVLIGLGSVLFHATLLYWSQLGDELPMIYAATLVSWVMYDTSRLNSPPTAFTIGLPIFLLGFAATFTWAYLVYPNPVFHQATFAAINLANTGRGVWMLKHKLDRSTPAGVKVAQDFKSSEEWGTFTVLFAFFIWNCDNLFCGYLTKFKQAIGPTWAIGFEGHAWWHVFIGYGFYLIIQGLTLLNLAIRDEAKHYELVYNYGFMPIVKRTEVGWKAVGGKSANKKKQ